MARVSLYLYNEIEEIDRFAAEMKSKGWEVTRTNYDFDREIYAWRHDVRGSSCPTLRISRQVLEDYPAFVVIHHLDQLKVARAMRAHPETRLVVLQRDSTVVLEGED